MKLLYLFESIRSPILDKFFLAVTELGDETFFIAAALIIFWCVSKKTGYYMMSVCFFGTIINQALKLMFRVPRPWIADPDFTIVEEARERAAGYSFPSGHTQNAVGIFGCIAAEMSGKKRGIILSGVKRRIAIAICILLAFFTCMSRLYLGVHTPLDVAVSAFLAAVLVLGFKLIFDNVNNEDTAIYTIIALMLVFASGYLAYAYSLPISSIGAEDMYNIEEGQKNAFYMLGGAAGIAVAYPIEKKFVKFNTAASPAVQVLKTIPGFLLVIFIKSKLKAPLAFVFEGYNIGIAHALRYFVIVFFAVCIWPMSFRYIERIYYKIIKSR